MRITEEKEEIEGWLKIPTSCISLLPNEKGEISEEIAEYVVFIWKSNDRLVEEVSDKWTINFSWIILVIEKKAIKTLLKICSVTWKTPYVCIYVYTYVHTHIHMHK